mmetsp:Transcript_113776/g.361578  ORF Transcript_113776/g.361578 Transcript_113776/m.361578 type:complete len:223 (-) Transcript_113776:1875-2543(-)
MDEDIFCRAAESLHPRPRAALQGCLSPLQPLAARLEAVSASRLLGGHCVILARDRQRSFRGRGGQTIRADARHVGRAIFQIIGHQLAHRIIHVEAIHLRSLVEPRTGAVSTLARSIGVERDEAPGFIVLFREGEELTTELAECFGSFIRVQILLQARRLTRGRVQISAAHSHRLRARDGEVGGATVSLRPSALAPALAPLGSVGGETSELQGRAVQVAALLG